MQYSFDKKYYDLLKIGAGSVLGIASQIPGVMLNGFGSLSANLICFCIGGCITTGFMFPSLYNERKKFHKIMDTDEFHEYRELYEEFVGDIAKFFSEMGISSDLRAALIYRICQEDGLFSKDRKVQFFAEDEKYDRFPDLMGARVATGSFCCRHSASLLTDIINKMGGIAADISVFRKNASDINLKFDVNHLITGLVHDNQSVLFDPTMPISCCPVGMVVKCDKNRKGKIITSTLEDCVLYREGRSGFSREQVNIDNLKVIKDLPSYEINEEQLVLDFIELCEDYFENSAYYDEFHNEEAPKIKRLAMLNDFITHPNKTIL